MSVYTGSQVFAALMRDAEFVSDTSQPKRVVWSQFCEAILETMGQELLNQPVTAETWIRAKLAIVHEQLDNHWTRRLLGEDWGSRSEPVLQRLIDLMEPMKDGVHDYLEARGVDARRFVEDNLRITRLNRAMIARMNRGDLTIGQLLITQPESFLRND